MIEIFENICVRERHVILKHLFLERLPFHDLPLVVVVYGWWPYNLVPAEILACLSLPNYVNADHRGLVDTTTHHAYSLHGIILIAERILRHLGLQRDYLIFKVSIL